MIVPYSAVTVAIRLLEAKLPALQSEPVFISNTVPLDDVDRMIRVDRLHGAMTNMVTDAPFMLFECWVRTKPGVYNGATEAETLANHVRACLADARSEVHGGAFVRYWRDGGANSHPDPDRPDMMRWQAIGTLGLSVKR